MLLVIWISGEINGSHTTLTSSLDFYPFPWLTYSRFEFFTKQIFFKYCLPFCGCSFLFLGLAKRTFSCCIYCYISDLLPILALFICDFEFLPKCLSPYRYFEVFYSVSLLCLMFGIFNLQLVHFALVFVREKHQGSVSPVHTHNCHIPPWCLLKKPHSRHGLCRK